MVTYTTKIENVVKHFPLKYALKEYKNSIEKLQKLTDVIYKISKKSLLIKKLVESGEIFSPIYLSEEEAYQILNEISLYESNGIVCRIPNWWEQRNENTSIKIDIEQRKRDSFGYFKPINLVNVSPSMYYNDIQISDTEIDILLNQTEGLSFFKGKWVEINNKKLKELLIAYNELKEDGTTLKEVLKINSKTNSKISNINIEFNNEDWLCKIAEKNLEMYPEIIKIPDTFKGTLRPYQNEAYKWLLAMSQYNFGVCLADDMGLGKTVEILAFLETYRKMSDKKVLLIVPSSLLNNWENEIKKFTPELDYYIAKKIDSDYWKIKNSFLTITTYQISQKLSLIYDLNWGIVILDEAQAIKNPEAIQSRKIKSIHRDMSIAMTGTPIENNLLNLWSIFDFLNAGLLGSQNEFRKNYDIKDSSLKNISSLSRIIKPFILRRLKSDKQIISDLPEKNENNIYIELSKKQIILYKEVVSEISNRSLTEENIFTQKRIILTTILHLKQICNHPSQYTGEDNFDINDSGKFMALKDICEIIFEKREKVLIFTQFKEITKPLNNVLKEIFKKDGFIITGDTSTPKRNEYIEKFQNEDIPYMILTLKTAGVGLNLTSAENVIHFDRWWNPAVENQATDRTYRIGQKKNINVYKFISKNTIEEIICSLLDEKTKLSNSVIDNIDNSILKKLSYEELIEAIMYKGDINE